MSTELLIYTCESLNNNKSLRVRTSKGTILTTINEEHNNAYVQGDKVIISRKDGKTVLYNINGSNRRQLS